MFNKQQNTPGPLARHPLAELALFTTAWHMLIHFMLSAAFLFLPLHRCTALFQWIRGYARLRHTTNISNQQTAANNAPSEFVWPTRDNYVRVIFPCALSTALDIGMSNLAIGLVTLSMYTMLKSTTPVFVLLVAFLLRLEPLRWQLVGIMLIMTSGVGLMVADGDAVGGDNLESTNGSGFLLGVGLVLAASFMSGVRWGLTQKLVHLGDSTSSPSSSRRRYSGGIPLREVQKQVEIVFSLNDDDDDDDEQLHGRPFQALRSRSRSPSPDRPLHQQNSQHNEDADGSRRTHHHPLRTMFLLSPIMSFFLFIGSLIVEQPFALKLAPNQQFYMGELVLQMSLGAVLGFCMILAEFWLIGLTSAVTLSVAGIGKELLTIGVASLVFADRLRLMNVIGLVVTLVAIVMYNVYRWQQQAVR